MRRIGAIVLSVAIALHAASAHAVLTNAFLLVNTLHARPLAMGDLGVADNSDASTIFFNPANVCAESRLYLTASMLDIGDLPDDTWLRSARAGFSWQSRSSSWTVGADAAYTRINYGDVFAGFGPHPDFYEDALAVSVGAGYRPGDIYELRLGAGVKRWRGHFPSFVNAELGVDEGSAAAFDIGAGFSVHERYGAWSIVPTLGASMMDMGDDVEWSDEDMTTRLPTRANLGAGVRIESAPCEILSARVPLIAMVLESDGTKPKDGDFEWGIGSEIAVAQILFLRSGVHRYATRGDSFFDTTSETTSTWGLGLGIPAGALRARLDYGRQPPANFAAIGGDVYYLSALVEWTF